MDAWSPREYMHFALAVSMSILLAELLESIVNLFPGNTVNFVAYNAWGFVFERERVAG